MLVFRMDIYFREEVASTAPSSIPCKSPVTCRYSLDAGSGSAVRAHPSSNIPSRWRGECRCYHENIGKQRSQETIVPSHDPLIVTFDESVKNKESNITVLAHVVFLFKHLRRQGWNSSCHAVRPALNSSTSISSVEVSCAAAITWCNSSACCCLWQANMTSCQNKQCETDKWKPWKSTKCRCDTNRRAVWSHLHCPVAQSIQQTPTLCPLSSCLAWLRWIPTCID